MDWRLYGVRTSSQECIVYLDSYYKAGDGIVDAYIDFRQPKDWTMFRQSVDLPESSGTYIEVTTQHPTA